MKHWLISIENEISALITVQKLSTIELNETHQLI